VRAKRYSVEQIAAKVRQAEKLLFVTSEGSPYGRLRRALDTGNARIALAAAADLPHVGLADALELLLLLLDSEPARFERAALRWHGRYCREVTDVDLAEAQAVLACLAGLRGARPEPAAHALADLVHRRDLARATGFPEVMPGGTWVEFEREGYRLESIRVENWRNHLRGRTGERRRLHRSCPDVLQVQREGS
jgi:hypothetical protein